MISKYFLRFTLFLNYVFAKHTEKCNIVFIVSDDLGWNDVSFHGSDQIMTPNIDVLAYEGVILQQYYTDTQGTPSRSALFTGKYPLRLGTQGISIAAAEDRGIPVSEVLLPAYLKDLGYATHLIGKWNVGKSRNEYLPTNRGFDSFYGFYDGSVDYNTYNQIENWNGTTFFGLDFFNNCEPVEDQTGHLTDILTDRAVQIIRNHNTSIPLYLHFCHAAPHTGGGLINLQPTSNTLAANDHIAHSARRSYAGLVTMMDKSIGSVVAALAEVGILQNTIIAFISDNGAPTIGPFPNFGSNLPLRGVKGTPWEGAVRSAALLWHPSIPSKILKGIFHVTDWVPTLVAAAGGNVTNKIDGINQWNAIKNNEKCKRKSVLITIDDLNGYAALREGDFKIIVGQLKKDTFSYYGKDLMELRRSSPSYKDELEECKIHRVFQEVFNLTLDIESALNKRNSTVLFTQIDHTIVDDSLCIPTKNKGCLYNVSEDPLEVRDLWYTLPDIVQLLALRLRTLWTEMKPRRQPKLDERANPSLRNYVWLPWLENDEEVPEEISSCPPFPLHVLKGELQYLINLHFHLLKEKVHDFIKNMGETFVKSLGGLFSF